MNFLNAFAVMSNSVLIPAIANGCQLALGALGIYHMGNRQMGKVVAN